MEEIRIARGDHTKVLPPERLTCSVEDAGYMIGVSRAVAYKLSRSEGFPVIRIGRRVLVSVQGLKEWIAKQTAQEANVK